MSREPQINSVSLIILIFSHNKKIIYIINHNLKRTLGRSTLNKTPSFHYSSKPNNNYKTLALFSSSLILTC